MKLSDQEMADLTRAAIERTRKSVLLNVQLVDDPEQMIALLISVSMDIIYGTASVMTEELHGPDHDDAVRTILDTINETLTRRSRRRSTAT